MKITDYLRNDIREREKFNTDIVCENVRRGRIIGYFSICFEAVYSVVVAAASLLKVDSRFDYGGYLLMYLLMIAINAVYLLGTRKYAKTVTMTAKTRKRIDIALITYISLIMVWSSVISLMDQRLYGHLMAFVVNMILCSVLYLLNNLRILIPYVLSVGVLAVGLPFFQPSSDVLVGHYGNLFFFVVISWLTSRIVYRNYCENFNGRVLLKQTNEMLESKIEENRKINERLGIANSRLQELAMIDELTGIPNRRSFREYIDRAFDQYVGEHSTMSVIMMDIDFFKQFNDRYGHEEGDRILIAVANEINAAVSDQTEFALRWGGEEFVYTGFNKTAEEVEAKANAICRRVSDIRLQNNGFLAEAFVTVSVGVCTVPISEKKEISRVIAMADMALYQAKDCGRNCVRTLKDDDRGDEPYISEK